MATQNPRWTVDPMNPKAPPMDVWNAMSDDERAAVIDALPSEIDEPIDATVGEGEPHRDVITESQDVLRGYFRRSGRPVYVAANMAVYYPDESEFAPDLFAVRDVPLHKRASWVVAAEGRGLDVVIEVLFRGHASKDLRDNVQRYASLGISEYFVFDGRRRTIRGWRLPHPTDRTYQAIIPQVGWWRSDVLGLELGVEGDRFRFYVGEAPLPETRELLERANRLAEGLQDALEAETQRAEAETQRAEAETQRAEAQARRAAEAEAKLTEALARLRELEGKPS